MGIMFNKWPRDGTLKTYRKNLACRSGSTQAYAAHPVKGDKQSVQSLVPPCLLTFHKISYIPCDSIRSKRFQAFCKISNIPEGSLNDCIFSIRFHPLQVPDRFRTLQKRPCISFIKRISYIPNKDPPFPIPAKVQ